MKATLKLSPKIDVFLFYTTPDGKIRVEAYYSGRNDLADTG